MPKRNLVFIQGAYYHIYQRGVNRAPIFFEDINYTYFLDLTKQKLENHLKILAFVLMPNHFHFMVEALSEDVSESMRRLLISYTKAMNRKYNRTGPLFDTQFKARHIDNEAYLVHLSKYIHNNPIQSGLVTKPEDWHASSYHDYLHFPNSRLSNPEFVLSQFSDAANPVRNRLYQLFVENDVFPDEEMKSLMGI